MLILLTLYTLDPAMETVLLPLFLATTGMASNLALSMHDFIYDMIRSGDL
jgi:hypothetical protein